MDFRARSEECARAAGSSTAFFGQLAFQFGAQHGRVGTLAGQLHHPSKEPLSQALFAGQEFLQFCRVGSDGFAHQTGDFGAVCGAVLGQRALWGEDLNEVRGLTDHVAGALSGIARRGMRSALELI